MIFLKDENKLDNLQYRIAPDLGLSLPGFCRYNIHNLVDHFNERGLHRSLFLRYHFDFAMGALHLSSET
jgi:hypothetical protein